ncbi:pentatricopeptide repeat-containing protein At5g66520-like [Coffea arabica]|uniref:Pentatricopeptide repeat-containing protein At5g66520-like n=1 Tax=Coffea arabica TaxID=13443 RepID=A0A6P6V2N7_COFAR|nr:pentatricopeptide repeat-containing protein At5g66520-like [Coffea arabica]
MQMSASRRSLQLLEKCRNMRQLKQAHGQAITCGLGANSYALSRLLAFCSDPVQGSLFHGYKIFEQIEQPTICICNTMIKALLLKKELEKTIAIYKDMLRNGMYPDNYTLPYMLKACANMENYNLGELIHGHCFKSGFLFNTYVVNSLIFMYSGFLNMEAARLVFDEMPWPCVVSRTLLISGYAKKGDVYGARLVFDEAELKDRGIWGAMLSGYVQNNCFKEGLLLFRLMQLDGVEPDEAILVSALCACAHLGCLDIGIWVHRYVGKGNLPLSVKLGTALMDMYAKCGYLDVAEKVFYEMPRRDVICWNTMISGFAMNGNGKGALKLFREMEKNGIRPDDITFISLFTACSYSCLAHEGLMLLDVMCNVYGLEPRSEHYGCIIDFLSRAGLLEEAKTIVHRMPNSNGSSEETIAWRALLSACCSHGEIHLAEAAAERLVQLERHSGAYVLLSNVYSAAGRYDCAKRMRKKMRSQGIDKAPGCSSVEINGVAHEFIAGEKTHLLMDEVCGLLETLHKQSDFSWCDSRFFLSDYIALLDNRLI